MKEVGTWLVVSGFVGGVLFADVAPVTIARAGALAAVAGAVLFVLL